MFSYSNYVKIEKIHEKTEIEKVKYTLYYYRMVKGENEKDINDIENILKDNGMYISNLSRLKSNMKKSNDFKVGSKLGTYTLSSSCLKKLGEVTCLKDTDYIETEGGLLDENCFIGKRDFLDKLILQANNCYENNCYDACATMLRRILEILLILSYRNLGIEDDIKDSSGNYFMLEKICTNAKGNKILGLSRIKNDLDVFRDIRKLCCT